MSKKTNFIVILADDMGYGDLSCLNDESKINTVEMDRIASEGVTFTDAHAGSSVCTPSRYSILTGRYAWRGKLQKSVLGPYESPLLEDDIVTMPQILKNAGYKTACVGKWHLGMDWPGLDQEAIGGIGWSTPEREKLGWQVDYNQQIKNGPLQHGFDYYFGVDVPNFPPYCFIENDCTVGIPTINKPDNMYGAPGPMLEGWDLEQVMPSLENKAIEFIEDSVQQEEPFFLYFSMTGPHTPIAPTDEFKGTSQAGPYGDFVTQLDSTIGKIDKTLQEYGISENTVLVITSDNGSPGRNGSLEDPGTVLETYGHNPSWILRGMKADTWDGGHRIPCIVKWPQQVKASSYSDRLVCLTDLMATFSKIADAELPETAEDSVDLLPLLTDNKAVRNEIVHHSHKGMYGIRKGDWKLIVGSGSGGFSPDPVTTLYSEPEQLYNMNDDIRERKNLYFERRDKVYELSAELDRIRFKSH